jgi:hypothetical protein
VPAPSSRSGRVPIWLPIGLMVSLGAWLATALERDVEAGFTRIEPRFARLTYDVGFADPRWDDVLRKTLAGHASISAHDRAAQLAITEELALLPFVADVGEPSVVWPQGLHLPVKLRVPAACVRSGNEYLLVAEDGTILPCTWVAPPWIGVGFVPVIGPNDGAFDRARAGDMISEPRHLDALAIARSMRAALTSEEFEAIGPPLIDATLARTATVENHGARILLENRRVVYYGRAPGAGEPGELPTERKWDSLARAARALGDPSGARDWSLVDVRWDTPDIRWRTTDG